MYIIGEADEKQEEVTAVPTDEVNSVSVASIIKDEEAVWMQHVKLKQPSFVGAFGALVVPIWPHPNY